MPGATPRRKCLASPRKFFRGRDRKQFPNREILTVKSIDGWPFRSQVRVDFPRSGVCHTGNFGRYKLWRPHSALARICGSTSLFRSGGQTPPETRKDPIRNADQILFPRCELLEETF